MEKTLITISRQYGSDEMCIRDRLNGVSEPAYLLYNVYKKSDSSFF